MNNYGRIGLLSLAILCSSSTPQKEDPPAFKFYLPAGIKNRFEYTIDADSPLLSTKDIGSVVWRYETRRRGIKSEFFIDSGGVIVSSALGANKSTIESINLFDKSKDGIGLRAYTHIEEVYKQSNPKYKMEISPPDRGSKEKFKFKCVNRKAKPTDKIDRCPIPEHVDNPGIFAVLAGVAYIHNLERTVSKGRWQPAFYQGRNRNVRLDTMAEETLDSNGELDNDGVLGSGDVQTVKYNVENIGSLFGGNVGMYIWLRKGYPHHMEKAELRTNIKLLEKKIPVTITVRKKLPQKRKKDKKRRRK